MYCPNKDCPDARASGVPGEYRDGIHTCPRCHSHLVAARPTWAELREPETGDDECEEIVEFVTIGTITDRAAVPVIHSLLSAAGIRFFIRNERPLHLAAQFAGVAIVVESSRAVEACELLARPDVRWVRN